MESSGREGNSRGRRLVDVPPRAAPLRRTWWLQRRTADGRRATAGGGGATCEPAAGDRGVRAPAARSVVAATAGAAPASAVQLPAHISTAYG